MGRRLWLLMILALLLTGAGCGRFQSPGRLECEAGYDGLVAIQASRTADGDSDKEWLMRPIIRGVNFLTGDKRAWIRKCMVTMSRHEAICFAKSSSVDALKKCIAPW
jgi:hypothetical protein